MRLDEAPKKSSERRARPGMASGSAPRTFRRAGGFSSTRVALMRLSRSKALLLTVGLGMLVAVVLICAVPLYDALMANVQLQRVLNASDSISRNLEVQVESAPVNAQARAVADPRVSALAQQYISGFTASPPTYYTVADNMLLIGAGGKTFDPTQAPGDVSFRAFDYTVAAPYMHIFSGAVPQDTTGTVPQALITREMATGLHLRVGDAVAVTQFGDHSRMLRVKVSGIWQPVNANDPFWNGLSFAAQSSAQSPIIYPVLLTYDGLFSSLRQFSGLGLTQHWIYYTQIQHITAANLSSVVGDLSNFRSRVNGDLLADSGVSGAGVHGTLDSILGGVSQQESLLALPLYVIAIQVVGLALLFVATMAGLLIEGQSQDIATLKSRGLSGTQILGVYITQGTVLGIVAVVIGPILAALLSLALVRRLLPAALASSSVGSSFLSQIASPRAALVPAIAGALLGVATIALAALQAARMDILAFRREQARPSRQPLWRRYYLDVALAVLCFVGYYELGQFGNTNTRLQVGGAGSNPLLLASPALLLLAGALIVLRLVPMAAALGERIAARGRGITSVLAFAQVERSPGRYTRMTLLLVLAVGLGLFALTFNATLTHNVSDRVAYSVGADLRITQASSEAGALAGRIEGKLQQTPGVVGITPVYRTVGSTSFDLGNQTADVLAIDPKTFASVVEPISWRSDYASQSLTQLMAEMSAHAPSTSAGGSTAPIWAIVSQSLTEQLQLHQGDHFTLQLSDSLSAPSSLIVGEVVRDFPTLYPGARPAGFLIVPYTAYLASATAGSPSAAASVGPNEFWLRTSGDSDAVLRQLQANHYDLDIRDVRSRADELIAAQANPISGGIRGLLLVGAFTAALLAVLGSVVQSLLAARQRTTQFAILRTIGMANQQMTRLLLGEQVVVYVFGLVGGTVLGLLLTSATLPFLQFSDTTVDPTTLGVPPYVLNFNPGGIALFYAALIVAFLIALAVAARYAATIGLGKALRLGED